jgi:esterase/lipase superfamily enzyme
MAGWWSRTGAVGGVVATLAAALAGCGARGEIATLDGTPTVGAIETILVASSRQATDTLPFFGDGRSDTLNFAAFDVSVPPDRQPGTVVYSRRPPPDPRKHFLVVDAERLDGDAGFVAAVNREVAKRSADEDYVTLFVHGYNTNFAEGLFRQAQLQYDMAKHGVSMHFAWPSSATTFGYMYDRESALYSRDALAETVAALERSKAGGYNLVAHSMGAFLLMDMLRTVALGDPRALSGLNEVILVSPDIGVDIFHKQATPVLALGVPIVIIVSRDDRALRISAGLRGETDRLGSIRSRDEIAGLDVSVVDVSDIARPDALGHFKIATSPQLVAYIKHLNEHGLDLFDQGKRKSVLESGVTLFDTGTDILVSPLRNL